MSSTEGSLPLGKFFGDVDYVVEAKLTLWIGGFPLEENTRGVSSIDAK